MDMGYNTIFTGKLLFDGEQPISVVRKINSLAGEDCRDHPEWKADDLFYIDFRVTKDMDGIEWDDGTEKTYDAEKLVNVIIRLVREDHPSFALKGELVAQGEEYDDRWRLVIGEDGWAHRVEFPRIGQRVTCPNCEEEFTLEETATQ